MKFVIIIFLAGLDDNGPGIRLSVISTRSPSLEKNILRNAKLITKNSRDHQQTQFYMFPKQILMGVSGIESYTSRPFGFYMPQKILN